MVILKMIKSILLLVVVLLLSVVLYFFAGNAPVSKRIAWGIDFSQMQSERLGLNWKENYIALLDDLLVKNIKLHTQWDFIEGTQGQFYYNDIDWQLQEAKKRDATIIFVVGMKTGRWPECHLPGWTDALSRQQQQDELLNYITHIVSRYKGDPTIVAWQVENEPLFPFGECPWYDHDFLKKEFQLVKTLDPSRLDIISDSGELSSWFDAAKIGDVVGTTLYRKAWINISSFGVSFTNPGFYGTYPIPPVFYYRKASLIKNIFHKDVICVELQAEPWGQKLLYDTPLEEQEKTMNVQQFKDNIRYAKKTGFNEIYLWGAEWWYWMKEVHHRPEFWNEAKTLFQKS